MTRNALLARILLVVACAGIVTSRWMVLGDGLPPGYDTGNWLYIGQHGFGAGGTLYPPVIPVTTLLTYKLFGFEGLAGFAALASIAPGLGVFIATRGRPRVPRVIAAVMLAASFGVAEATAWGGTPQLVALGLVAICLGQLADFDESSRFPLVLGLCLSLLLGVSHLFGLLVIAIAVAVALADRFLWARPWRLPVLARVFGPSVPWVMLYLPIVIAAAPVSRPGPQVGLFDLADVPGRELIWFWRAVAVAAVMVSVPYLRDRRRGVLGIALAIVWGTLAMTGEVRVAYCLPVLGVLTLVRSVEPLSATSLRVGATAGATVVAILVAARGYRGLVLVRPFYQALTPGMVAASEYVAALPEQRTVGVSPRGDAPAGWWIAGLSGRRVVVGSAPHWLLYESEQREAEALGRSLDALDRGALEASSVDVLVLLDSWDGFDSERFRDFVAARPELVALVREDVLILDLELGR